jgi:hypothetical protein
VSAPPTGPGGPGQGWPPQPPFGYPGYPQQGPPPGYPPPGYPPPGYPPPGYPPPGYPPPGYPPPGYPPPGYPPALKPGVIPLRPLTLSDIFNGAVGYVRANPKATLGLTTVVVVITQVIALVLRLGPLAATGQLVPLRGEQASAAALLGSSASTIAGGIATALAGILLSGMLTVVVGRAVFGSSITIEEAWGKVKGRLWALIGLAALEALGLLVIAGVVAVIIAGVAVAANGVAALLVGLPLALGAVAALVYLYTALSFAPMVIVLERLPVVAAITRSFALVRNSFWRVLGIRVLAGIVVAVIAGAVTVPFSVGGQLLLVTAGSAGPVLVASVLTAIGGAIGEIITAPFSAGVVVLLYTDRRIRAEAFDLVLQTGATGGPTATESTDNLWLTRPR